MSAAKQTEREKQLETERATAIAEREDYKAKYEQADEARKQAEAQRDQLLDEASKPTAPQALEPEAVRANTAALSEEDFATVLDIVIEEAHRRGIIVIDLEEKEEARPEQEQTEADAPAEEHAETKGILRRNGLKEAYLMPDGSVQFDKKHVLHMVGAEAFDSLTVISAE